MNKLIRVVSLFDGNSGAQQALRRNGVNIGTYYASEIDKHGINVTMRNFPNTIQIGDVTKVDGTQFKNIDLLIGGSPCQSFSFAGKRKGMSTIDEIEIHTLGHYLELKSKGFEFEGQSYLFWEYMRLLKEIKPKYFLLENVPMGKKWESILSRAIGVKPIEINSNLVSAQNRKRLYWTNIGMIPSGIFGDMVSNIKQPTNKNILLKDVLEPQVYEKYYLSKYQIEKMLKVDSSLFDGDVNYSGPAKQAAIKFGRTEAAKATRKQSMAAGKDYTPFQAKQITNLDFEKMNTLTTAITKDNLIMQLNPSTESQGRQPYQQNRIYSIEGIAPALMAQMSCKTYAIKEGSRIRRLTPVECERLQTIEDNYTDSVSASQRYKMIGNGFTIDVIGHILSYANW
jgi:DNA (cytosine-5)-methyltransferase 3A